MKTIALEQVGQPIAEALEQHRREEPILLTRGSDAIGLLLRLPEGTRPSDIEAKSSPRGGPETASGSPVFGSRTELLTIVAEDEEHLQDYEEYVR
jgi:hypothetical protein